MSLVQMSGLEPEERGEKRDQEEKVEQDGGGHEHMAKEAGGVGNG